MSTHRSRIDRDTAERLLRRASVPPRAGAEPLAGLLAAAAAPPRPDELAGEPAVMAAFRAARLGPVPQTRRRSMIKMALAKLLTLKVAAAAVTVTAAGGVALAATSGNLPGVANDKSRPPAHATAQAAAEDDGSRGNGSPSPSLVGLCQAFQAGAGDNPGKALENPAFRALIDAAGDEDGVADYCTTVLDEKAAGQGSDGTQGKDPTSHPTGADGHPTGAPEPHPSDAGKPTVRPSH